MALRCRVGKLKLIPLSFSRKASSCSAELLTDRSVLNVKRESCADFLQGLITNDVNLLTTQRCLYAMLLNPKGRVLHDVLVYKTESPDEVNIECSSAAVDSISKHLKVYSLRKKVEIVKSNLSIWAVFQENGASHDFIVDPRCSQPWVHRHLSTSPPCDTLVQGTYSKLRYSLGIAEGPHEIPVGEAFPLEYNADLLNGVSFDKGCYVGQELTARVHHTGVIRKRIMPLELSETANDDEDLEDPIKDSGTGKAVGKIRGLNHNRALALMRVTETIAAKELYWGRFKVKAIIPKWWPPLVKESDVVKRQQ